MNKIIPIISIPKVILSAYAAWKAFGYLVFEPLAAGYVRYCNTGARASVSRSCDYEYFPSVDFFTILWFQGALALMILLVLVGFCLWGTKWQKYASLLWFGFVGIILVSVAYLLVLVGVAVYSEPNTLTFSNFFI